jgi:pimeloyl-ACP methyl ester carboxylesterase
MAPKFFASYSQRNFRSSRRAVARRSTTHLEAADRKLVLTYEPALAETLADSDIEHPLPPLWDQFDALAPAPVLVIRGANSNILSVATLREMQAHHPNLVSLEVPDQGYVPVLDEPDLINRIVAFVERCEHRARS